jgi:hypothetical protein
MVWLLLSLLGIEIGLMVPLLVSIIYAYKYICYTLFIYCYTILIYILYYIDLLYKPRYLVV